MFSSFLRTVDTITTKAVDLINDQPGALGYPSPHPLSHMHLRAIACLCRSVAEEAKQGML